MGVTSVKGLIKGLIKKEWILMKWGVITVFLLNIVVVMAAPPIINRAFGLPLNTFENSLVISGAWFVVSMLVPIGILFASLETEMKRPDIWLHSPVPMWKLVGIKAIFALAVTAMLLVLGGILLSISFLTSDAYGTIPKLDGALSMLSVMISIFLKSIYIMAFGFLFWSVYQVGRSRLSNLSVIFTTLLFFAGIFTGTVISELLRASKILTAIKEFGPVKLTNVPFYNEHNSYLFTGIVPDGVIFTVGGLILYGSLTIFYFAVGVKLFEKKVRL